ncbi:hypothetical protein [Burkholderia ubonensis]|uniref:hypothetical protein n=1 Tax=Burkholderia ubonensis TaxID=101571 RepID=UPI000756A09D|nr:hypothetical protein [Burkholderia ubonensis]KVN31454.1 hypothetical protein WJ64_12345 [Burkholderia ubonensis]
MSEPLQKEAPTYRRFRSDDIAAAHALSQTMSWPHRAEDWRFMLENGGGFVALRSGAVIGTALCWQFGQHCGTVGLVIVSPRKNMAVESVVS